MPRRTDDRDDLHTVANMSGLDGGMRLRDLLSDARDASGARGQGVGMAPSSDVRDELSSPEERLAVILGTLRAALSIGMVYVVVFGLFIALLLAIWSH